MQKQDPRSRVAVETLVTTGQRHAPIVVKTKSHVEIPTILREQLLQIGYHTSAQSFACGLRDRLAACGSGIPALPGIMPLTTTRTLTKAQELSGAPAPAWLRRQLESVRRRPARLPRRAHGIVTELCQRPLVEGVAGLHFYTLNRSEATRELVHRLGLANPHRAILTRPIGLADRKPSVRWQLAGVIRPDNTSSLNKLLKPYGAFVLSSDHEVRPVSVT